MAVREGLGVREALHMGASCEAGRGLAGKGLTGLWDVVSPQELAMWTLGNMSGVLHPALKTQALAAEVSPLLLER